MTIRNIISSFIFIFDSIGIDDDRVICSWLHSISCYDLVTSKLSNYWSSICFQITCAIITFLAFFRFNNIGSILKYLLSNFHAASSIGISNVASSTCAVESIETRGIDSSLLLLEVDAVAVADAAASKQG